MITVLRGAPDEAELAAVTVALLLLTGEPDPEPPRQASSGWTADAFTAPGSWSR